ncbi:MAG: pilus assembly protein [Lachnospiraceae bacterium]|nr:pilus assembly protein [Lachnospiraceae bacterium]
MCRKLTKIPSRSATMACRDIKQKKSERGSITLEAAVFLTLFILFYVAMMDLIQIAKAQVILQYSVNEAAKEISAYNYVLTKAGITDKRTGTAGKAAEFKGEISDVIGAVEKLDNTLANGDVAGAFDAMDDLEENISKINVEEIPEDIISLLKTMAADGISDSAIQAMVKSEVKKQIGMASGKDADQFLRELGIENGMAGLDFSESAWAAESKSGIPVLEVAVVYTINIDLGYLKLEPREFKLCAKTGLW